MPLCCVIDFDPDGHGADVRSYFLHDAPEGWTCEVVRPEATDGVTLEVIAAGVDEAILRQANLIIYAWNPPWPYREAWKAFHAAGGLTVASHGSNLDGQYLTDPPGLVPYMVVVGGETLADGPGNDRSEGPGLMLDAITHDGNTAESYAAAVVAAALAHLYDRLDSWPEAVSALLSHASGGTGAWTPQTGYGVYVQGDDLTEAAPDVYPVWYVEGDETAALTIDGRVLSWEPSGYAGAYRIVRIGSVEEVIAEEGRGATEYEDAEASPYETHGYRVDVLHAPSAETPLFASEWVYVRGLPNPAFRGVYPAEV